MFEYPQYDADGSEELSFQNIWRDISPQSFLGTDCFLPYAQIYNDENLVELKLTGSEYTKILSSIMLGSQIAYPQEWMQIYVNWLKGTHCPPTLKPEECKEYPPYSAFIQYPLQNPFSQPELIPDGYLTQPMVLVTDENIDEYPQNELGDVVVPFGAISFDADWFEDLSGQLPTAVINVQGEGNVNVKLLNQAQGGLAVITLDNPPNLVDILAGIVTGADNIIDTNLDILSLPPETAVEHIFSVEVVGEGMHQVYVVFFPIVDDSLIPLRFGGGFRGAELCGFLEMPEMGIQDLRFDPTFRLQKLIVGDLWEDVEGAETFDLAIQAIQQNAAKAYAGAIQLLTESIDPTYPEMTWLGSQHQLTHEFIGTQAALAFALAESLRDITEVPEFLIPGGGFIGSDLQAYIDAGGTPIDVEALETAIAAAQADADAAQAASDANTLAISALGVQVDDLDTRLTAIEASQMWNVHFDFLTSQHGFSGSPDWTIGVGFELFGVVSINRSDSFLPDGRLMYMRLEMTNADSVTRTYTVRMEGYDHESSYGRAPSGDLVHYHKIQNEATPNDLGLEFNTSSTWILKAATFYGVGTPTITAP